MAQLKKISKGHRSLKNRFIDNNFITILKKIFKLKNFKISSHWQNFPQQSRSLQMNVTFKICFILAFLQKKKSFRNLQCLILPPRGYSKSKFRFQLPGVFINMSTSCCEPDSQVSQ